MRILKYNGGYIIKNSYKVPKTVLEDVWAETLTKIRKNQDFNMETVEKIGSIVKKGMITRDDIIDLLND